MSVTQKLVTTNFNVESAASFVNTFADSDYFLFAGRHIPYPGSDTALTTPNNSIKSINLEVYDNMIFAKRISETDVAHVIPKYSWSSGTYYNKYDHTDGDLYNKPFYTVVNDIGEFNVYKCLFNASNTSVTVNSTVAPSIKTLDPIVTGDGYIWKYMYSITKAQYEKFATTKYIPVIANTTVIDGAVPGTIEVIDIINAGKGYNNYIASAVFKTADLSVGGVNTIYAAPEDSVAEDDYYRGCVLKITVSSSGAAGQYRRIVDYKGVGGQKFFVLDSPFNVAPTTNDVYEVYPYVYIWGDGTETKNADARVIIDPAAANSIVEVEILDVGENYRYGESYPGKTPDLIPVSITSAFIDLPVTVSSAAGFEQADLRPILSPPGGHGSNPLKEMFAKRICISTKYNNSEAGTIPIQNDFRQVGILKNPLYTNVDVIVRSANSIGNFVVGETVCKFKQFKLHGNVNITSANSTVIKTDLGKISNTVTILNAGLGYDSSVDTISVNNAGTGGSGFAATFANNGSGVITSVNVTNQGTNYNTVPTLSINTLTGTSGQLELQIANPQTPTFKDTFEVGDYALINKNTNNYLAKVQTVSSDNQLVLSTNSTFTANNCEISALVLQASGRVTSVSAGQLTLTDVSGVFSEESKIVGLTSGATSIIESTVGAGQASIQVNDKSALSFNTAVQLTRLVGNFPSGGGAFLEDELVEQQSLVTYAQPRGAVHHLELNDGIDDDILYISNKFGIYNLDPDGVRQIAGATSGATLENLSNKYPGDFVVGSGEVLYIENLDPITRSDNKSEIIKIILEF
jgi:hypothetical protein